MCLDLILRSIINLGFPSVAMIHADIVIVGGGLVGASLAAALTSPAGIFGTDRPNVVLIDPSPPEIDDEATFPSISLRTSTLNPSSVSFLRDLNIWRLLPPSRITPVDALFVWDVPPGLEGANFAYTDSSITTPKNFVDVLPNVSFKSWAAPANKAPPGVLKFCAKDTGHEVLAYVVDNSALRHALYLNLREIIQNSASPLRILQSSLETIHYPTASSSSSWPIVQLSNGVRVKARLVAACDGGMSKVRRLAKADWIRYEYGQSAVVANVHVADASCTAFQRFVSTGPVALLPLSSPHIGLRDRSKINATGTLHRAPLANVVWTTSHAEARALLAADEKTFVNELNAVFSMHEDGEYAKPSSPSPMVNRFNRNPQSPSDQLATLLSTPFISFGENQRKNWPDIPRITGIEGPRAKFPLSVAHAPRYVLPESRTVLVGDAAHVVHPLAGQGVNLGFGDVESLAHCVRSAIAVGRDIGGEDGAPLRPYERDRVPPNLMTIVGLHALSGIYSPTGPVRALRRVGMSAINMINPFKRAIQRIMR